MTEVHGKRIDDIECLRALAVIGVIIQHAHDALYAPTPWFDAIMHAFGLRTGVDLFFAISGFVIGRSFLPEMEATSDGRGGLRIVAAFWTRRFFRLTPSAWLWLWLTLLMAIFFNRSGVFQSVHANLMATLAGMFDYANFRFADSFMKYDYGSSFVYWSLSLEEQFYLLLPLCALLLRRWLPAVLLALIVFQALLPTRGVLAQVLRTDAIAWGVLLSIACGGRAWRKAAPIWLEKPWLRWPVLVGLLVMLARLGSDVVDPSFRWKIAVIALLAAALVWMASYDQHYLFRPGWLRKPLLWIGARSYAIYLIHLPVYLFVREIATDINQFAWASGFRAPIGYSALTIALMALLADANYRWVETPLRGYGAKVAARIVAPRGLIQPIA